MRCVLSIARWAKIESLYGSPTLPRLLAGLACYAMRRTVVVAPSGSRRTLNGNPVVVSCVRLGSVCPEQRRVDKASRQ
jgi:hypothetical protein